MMDVYMQAGLVDEALKLCHPFAKQYEGQNEGLARFSNFRSVYSRAL
jgi:hypothetical protein